MSGAARHEQTPDVMSETTLRARLRSRGRMLAAIRGFFAERDVIEVSTTAISPYGATDPALANVTCEVGALGGRQFLHTSPEHAMKRLLAAGSGDIWQLARVFRDGELGRWHQPEFLLLEWYRVGVDETALMDEVHALLNALAALSSHELERLDLAYGAAFADGFGVDAHHFDDAEQERLRRCLGDRGIDVPAGTAPGALLDLALGTVVVPSLPNDTAVFLFDYPREQAALAAIKTGRPAVAARFEVFVNGVELANGFRELTDAAEQRRRFERDRAARVEAGLPDVPIDEDLLAALESGLPPCAGVAVGLDRLVAVLSKQRGVAAVVDWPHEHRSGPLSSSRRRASSARSD